MISYDKTTQSYYAECDQCCFDVSIEADSFSDVVIELKEQGWRIQRDGESRKYTHLCHECADTQKHVR